MCLEITNDVSWHIERCILFCHSIVTFYLKREISLFYYKTKISVYNLTAQMFLVYRVLLPETVLERKLMVPTACPKTCWIITTKGINAETHVR